ncbi:MAG: tetratricopeptide repeat protein [Pseudomonadota bacterium]
MPASATQTSTAPIAQETARPAASVLLKEAARHERNGAPDAAATLYRQTLAQYPKNQKAADALARITARRPSLPRATSPQQEAAFAGLHAANAAGQSSEVCRIAPELIAAHPHAALLRVIHGVALGKTNAKEAAVAELQVAEALRPDFAEAPYNLGVVFQAMDRHEEAIAAYARALKADPGKADAWNNIGAILQLKEDAPAALQAFDRAVAVAPTMVEALNNRGQIRHILGDIAGAISDFQTALALDPGHVKVYGNIAHALKLIGERDAAKTCFFELLKLDPDQAAPTRELAGMLKAEETARLRPIVDAQLAPSQPPERRMHAGYAAAYLDFAQGEDARGMAHLERAGALSKALSSYRTKRDTDFFDNVKACFAAPTPILEVTPEAAQPLFILGMPRSGTSLTEEILARHSSVTAAGELEYLNRAVGASGVLSAPPTPEALARLRREYLGKRAPFATGQTRFVTDKMPLNFRYIGYIAAAFPDAKIVHLRRPAEAVCWSNYKHCFPATGMAYSATQADVAVYYRLYRDLMAFWQDRFGDRIIDVDYDALADTPVVEAKKLVAALGLDWHDDLVAVEKSARSVRTASALQVKQGIYKGSSGAWRRYAPWLGDMLNGLGDARSEP